MFNNYKIVKNKTKKVKEKTEIVHFYNLSQEDKNILLNQYKIDEHLINSSIDPDEIARLETKKNNVNLIWKIPPPIKLGDNPSFDIVSVGFFIRNKKLIIVSDNFFDYLNEKLPSAPNHIYDLILSFQYLTIKRFEEYLKLVKIISRELQKKIKGSMNNEYLLNMFDLSETLIYYLEGIEANKSALYKFGSYLKGAKISFNEEYYQDLLIEIDQAHKQTDIYSRVLAGLMDARGNIVNNNMNLLIKNLTILNLVFLPLNFIGTVGGMSEFTMMTEGIPWQISYGVFMIVMMIMGLITLFIVNKYIINFEKRSFNNSKKLPHKS